MAGKLSKDRKALLQRRVKAFCAEYMEYENSDKLVKEYFIPDNPEVVEHGPEWAKKRLPYTGQWTGTAGCISHFTLLMETIDIPPGQWKFPTDPEKYVEEDGELAISVVGSAHFRAVPRGREFQGQFRCRFSRFDEEGRIGKLEVWGDPITAWTAVGSERNTSQGG
jgi:hypothetical protein